MDGIEELRRRIVAELEARDWSPRQASLKAGLSQNVVQLFLTRVTNGMSPRTCLGIARIFGWPEDDILELAGHKSPAPSADDPLAIVSDALSTGRWGEARGALLTLIELTDQERQQAAWLALAEETLDDILDEPLAAGPRGSQLSAAGLVSIIRGEFRERLEAKLAAQRRPP